MPLLELLASTLSGVEYLIILALLIAGGVGVPLLDEAALFISGYLALIGFMDIRLIILVGIIGTVIGSNIGYSIGKTHGQRFLKWWFKILRIPHYKFVRIERYVERHGALTLLLSRFTVVTRILAPVMAGAFSMEGPRFQAYNITGAIMWVPFVTYLGYFLGRFVSPTSELLLFFMLTAITLGMLAILRIAYRKIGDYD